MTNHARIAGPGTLIPLLIAALASATPGAEPAVPPPSAGPEKLADKRFDERGLIRFNTWIVLTDEADVRAGARTLRVARAKIAAEATARADIERAVRRTFAALNDLSEPFIKANKRLAANPKDNEAIAAVNVLIGQQRQQAAKLIELNDRLDKLPDGRAAFITDALALAKRVDAAVARYEALARDAEVTAALAALNAAAPAAPLKLGPSAPFAQDAAFVRECHGQISSNVIPVVIRGGVPCVDVLLNGKASINMIWDSGASSVALSHEMAKQAGLTPTALDPDVKISVADGRVITAKRMRLASVRVGSMQAENVECTVMPADAKDVPGLLGGTFQRNFICNLDLQRRELHLTRLDAPPPTTRPTGAAAATTQRTGPLPIGRRGKTVDLLAVVDPVLDTVEGTWVQQKGLLISDEGKLTRIQFPYHPPEEYDVRVVFRRTAGKGDISPILSKNGASWRWATAAYDNRISGFELIRNVNVSQNATSVKRKAWFVNGTTHSTLVKVRNKVVEGYVDDQLISTWKTQDYSEMTNPFPLDDPAALGLLTHKSRVEIVKAEVIEVTGQGEFTREVQEAPKR